MIRIVGSAWEALGRFVASRFAFHAVVAALLFVPHVFGSALSEPPWYFGVPRIASGDEPHYLVFIHSIVEDGDLSLANNYKSVHEGSDQAGYIFRGAKLNHHSIWYVGDRRVHWFEVFDGESSKWGKDDAGHPVPATKPNVDPRLLPVIERPWNSPGLPILLSPIFYLVRHTPWIEPLATLLAAIAVLFASIFWRMLARSITSDQRIVNVGVALAFLGTPAWHYARSFFSEPFLMCLLTGAYALALTRRRYVVAGFLIGMAIFIKPIAALMGMPIGVLLLLRRDLGGVARYTAPVLFWIGVHLYQNHVLYGAWNHTSNEWVSGWILNNAVHMFVNPDRGLLATAPTVLLAFAGWRRLARRELATLTILVAFASFFALVAHNMAWSGGYAYSLRFLVPLMPLFCLALVPLLARPSRAIVLWVGVISIAINGLAAMHYWKAFNANPLLWHVLESEYKPKR